MNEERDSQYMRWMKFDIKKKKAQQQMIFEQQMLKRKTSCPLSSEVCKSPFRKAVKQLENQSPGSTYFQSLIGTSTPQQSEEYMGFIQYLSSLQKLDITQLENSLQQLLRSVNFQDDNELIDCLLQQQSNAQQGQQWSNDETRILIWLQCKLGTQHNKWRDIGNVINHRSSSDCKVRWNQITQYSIKGTQWTPQEDLTLQNMIMAYLSNQQPINWKCMANVLNKSDRKCKDRWYNVLDNKLTSEAFTLEDDLELLKLVQKFGQKWQKIQREWSIPEKRSRQSLKKRFYELFKLPDSGYESDTSSQSVNLKKQLHDIELTQITELIEQLQNPNDNMQQETIQTPQLRGKELKNKLLSITKFDLDKMINLQRKINIESSSPLEQNLDVYDEIEEDKVKERCMDQVMNTPLQMNNLSRSLLKINLENDDDQLSIEKQFKQASKATYNVANIEQLKHEDLFDIQFCLVNERNNTLYYTSLEFMQQLLNLLSNQRKLMSLTNITSPKRTSSPERTNRKKFSSQQLIQVYPATELRKPHLSQFSGYGSDSKQP